MVMRRWLELAATEARNAARRAVLAGRVGYKTGLLADVRLGGVRAFLLGGAKTNPSMLFRYHAASHPHRTALVYRDRAYSYYELNEEMDRVCRGLRAHGVRPGDAVLVVLKNVPELLFLQGGAGRAGASVVSASWRSTPAELRYLIENAGVRALFFDASIGDVIAETLPHVRARVQDRVYAVRGDALDVQTYASLVSAGEGATSSQDLTEEGALVIYTSGTTGNPKGAVRRFTKDAAIQVLSLIEQTPMRAGQTHLTVCPLYHSTAFGFMTFSFVLGSRVVLLDSFEPESFVDAIERYGVHHTAVVPTMLHRLLERGPELLAGRDLSNLQAIFTGGAPLSGALAARVMDALGDRLYNFYGATETGVVTLASPDDLRRAPGTIGRVVGGNDILLTHKDGTPCAPGEVGELYVRSGNLVEGYHDNPGATAEATRQGYFSVGDLARVDAEGRYFLEGRSRDMIISGGVNVYPAEVEAVLSAHPAVGEAAVVGVVDEQWGERVVAFVALRAGETLVEVPELMAFCRERLSGPKRPRDIHLLDALPRNPTGKVLKRELRQRLG